jgi:hypothetical protein
MGTQLRRILRSWSRRAVAASIQVTSCAMRLDDRIGLRRLLARCQRWFHVPVQRPHHRNPRQHFRPVTFGNQQQRLHRYLPVCFIMLGFWQRSDVFGRVAQRQQLAPIRQNDRIDESLEPRHGPPKIKPRQERRAGFCWGSQIRADMKFAPGQD